MKKVITGIMPFLLLVLALTFMTQYKQWDDLSDTERYEIRSYVEAAEKQSDSSTASTEESDSSVASSSSNSDEASPSEDSNK